MQLDPPTWCYEPLTPLSFLERTAHVHRDRIAVVDGDVRRTYAGLADRSKRLAGALNARGFGPGSNVAVLAPNVELLLEAHFGVPWSGASLVALNTRLTPEELRFIVEHAACRLLIADHRLLAGC